MSYMSKVFRCTLEDKRNFASFHYLVITSGIKLHPGMWLTGNWVKEYTY